MSQNSILLEKSLHFSVRIVKLHRLLHRHEDDLSAELLKHADRKSTRLNSSH